MLRVNSIDKNISFTSLKEKTPEQEVQVSKTDGGKKIAGTLAVLAAAGVALVGLSKKTAIKTFEQKLADTGIEMREGVAKLAKSGKNYTGKIERYVSRNRKETVNFVDGIITEKVYHNSLGKELNGIFYKDGVQRYKVSEGSRIYTLYEMDASENLVSRSTCKLENGESKFDNIREFIKNKI